MSLRGKAAIVGIGEVPTRRDYPGRTTASLMTTACAMALEDAHLRKEDVDGLICNAEAVHPNTLCEYMQLQPSFSEGTAMHGASGTMSIALAAAAIEAGLAETVLCVLGGVRNPPPAERGGAPPSIASEFEAPYGPGQGAPGRYALLKQRYMHEYGKRDEQFAKIAADQRFNALTNPNSVFEGQPITAEDVMSSRFINTPLHLLECVMPCSGAFAAIVTSADRARSMPNPPVYLLGAGAGASDHDVVWQDLRATTSPVARTAPRAFAMAGYSPKDMAFAEFYD